MKPSRATAMLILALGTAACGQDSARPDDSAAGNSNNVPSFSPFADQSRCPPRDTLERLHSVLAYIEHGADSKTVDSQWTQVQHSATHRFPGAWRSYVDRLEISVKNYREGRGEAATIDESELRMELQESPCFPADFHEQVHLRLGAAGLQIPGR